MVLLFLAMEERECGGFSLWVVLVVVLFEYFEMEMVEEMKKMMNSIKKEIGYFCRKI